MSGTDTIKNIVGAINNGKSYPALSIVKNDPETAAVISKLVKSRELRRFDTSDSKSIYDLDQSRLSEISHTVKERITDAESMMQLFPDLELAAQILISSILSPKDMVNTEVIYTVAENVVPSDVSMKVLEVIKSHCENFYKLKTALPEILREMLFDSGSYVKAVIPESSVDELVNKGTAISTEDLTELFDKDNKIVSFGFLGAGIKKKTDGEPAKIRSTALEAFNLERLPYEHFEPHLSYAGETVKDISFEDTIGKFVEITDNFSILKLPKLIEANKTAKVKNRLRAMQKRISVENYNGTKGKISERELEVLLYKGTQSNAEPFAAIKTQRTTKRQSIGRPLNMRLPSEAVIPVHVPGDPKHHIGYFVLIDEEGNPVTRGSNSQVLGNLQSQLNNQSSSMTSFLLSKARKNLINQDNRNLSLDQAARIYSDIVESDLIERLRNGIYGSNVEISSQEDVYRIMLARTFANQFTRLVYIPSELVTYFSYKYYENGIGKSLLDDLKVITSLRAMLLFAKVMALTKNSIALTHVNMTLDPNDPDPQKTIELSVHEIIKMRQQYFPLGINSPVDLVDWIQRAGFEFSFEGHPGIPQTKFDFETKNMQHTVPDSDLDELLRKQTFMALGLSPETVDNGFSAEFATTVVANNILLSKRVLQIQEQFTPQLTDSVRKICHNDSIIREEVRKILDENMANIQKFLNQENKTDENIDKGLFLERLLEDVFESLELSLPKPDMTTLENQSQAYEHYSDSLDKAIDAYISSDFITSDLAGQINSNIDGIKAAYKAYFLRSWMAENGYMTELNDIITTNDDGMPNIELFTMMESHIEGLTRSSVKFIKSLEVMRNAANKDIEAMSLDMSNPGTDTSSSSSSDSSSGGDDFGMGGGDDFGMGDLGSLGGEETPSGTEETPAANEETPPENEEEGKNPEEETPPAE